MQRKSPPVGEAASMVELLHQDGALPTNHLLLPYPLNILEDVNSARRMDVEETTPAPAVEVTDAPKGKMSVEEALQQVLKNAMVSIS